MAFLIFWIQPKVKITYHFGMSWAKELLSTICPKACGLWGLLLPIKQSTIDFVRTNRRHWQGLAAPLKHVETRWNNIPCAQLKFNRWPPSSSCLCSEKGQKGSDEQSPYLRRWCRHWWNEPVLDLLGKFLQATGTQMAIGPNPGTPSEHQNSW